MSLFVADDNADEEGELILDLSNVHDDNLPAEVPEKADEAPEEEEETDDVQYPLISRDEGDDANLIDEIEPLDVNLTLPLNFQQLVLEDLLADDSLLILGKGLGLSLIVANLLHTLSSPATVSGMKKRGLVLVIGANDNDNSKLGEELKELSWMDDDGEDGEPNRPFHIIKSDTHTSDKRQKLYQTGGIMSVTSRILVVDFLSGIINAKKVTGILILHAERVNDLSNESFVVHMYRQANKWGFIKAVSDSPEDFTTGFAPLHKKLKDLKLKKILLWPRFHIEVSSSLINRDSNKTVTEIKVPMTDSMKQIQIGILSCLKKCIDELRRKIPNLAIEYWNIENALDNRFLGSIHMILDPNWHRIPYDAKQLVKDIKLLKDLLRCLICYDCVDFYDVIQLVLEANKPSVEKRNTESPWLMAEESHSVITLAKKRVFNNDSYVLEESPKWEQLAVLMNDIVIERSHQPSRDGPVLIMCSNKRVSRQLKRFLNSMKEVENSKFKTYSGRRMMIEKLQMYMDTKETKRAVTKSIQEVKEEANAEEELNISRAFARAPITTNRRRTRGGGAVAAVQRALNAPLSEKGDDIESRMSKDDIEMELFEEDNNNDGEEVQEPIEEDDIFGSGIGEAGDFYEYLDRDTLVVIDNYETCEDNILDEIMPSFVVMYEPNLSFIRKVEVFQATYKSKAAKTYFMYYNDSVEEQMHLTSIKKEKEAFTKLIREKSKLPTHFETDEDVSSRFRPHRAQQAVNTRIAGGMVLKDPSESRVIVDTREFRASLPGLLYRIGIKVIPCMLTVGDYIISPSVCIERKSIPDLIGSFKSGRLYEQCAKMSKHYHLPTLLIEFDNNQSFSLEPFSETRVKSNNIQAAHPSSSSRMQDEMQMNLAQLILKFPKLKILWSSSPYQTAELIMELKMGREEPDIVNAVNAGLNEQKQRLNHERKESVISLLQNIPGITNLDYYAIMKKVKDVDKLLHMQGHEISALVGEDLGARIFEYIRSNYGE